MPTIAIHDLGICSHLLNELRDGHRPNIQKCIPIWTSKSETR